MLPPVSVPVAALQSWAATAAADPPDDPPGALKARRYLVSTQFRSKAYSPEWLWQEVEYVRTPNAGEAARAGSHQAFALRPLRTKSPSIDNS